jgi:hypothetical protein
MYTLEVGENDVAIERVPVVDLGVLDDGVRDGVSARAPPPTYRADRRSNRGQALPLGASAATVTGS